MEKIDPVQHKLALLKEFFQNAGLGKPVTVKKEYYRFSTLNPMDGKSFFFSFRFDFGLGKRGICAITINLDGERWNTLFSIHTLDDKTRRYPKMIFRKRTKIYDSILGILEKTIAPTLAEKLTKLERG